MKQVSQRQLRDLEQGVKQKIKKNNAEYQRTKYLPFFLAGCAALGFLTVRNIHNVEEKFTLTAPGTHRFRVTYPQTMSLPDVEDKKETIANTPGLKVVTEDARSLTYDMTTGSTVHFKETYVAEDGTTTVWLKP